MTAPEGPAIRTHHGTISFPAAPANPNDPTEPSALDGSGWPFRHVALFCDVCSQEGIDGDFRAETREQAFAALRRHAAEPEQGWRITPEQDTGPRCLAAPEIGGAVVIENYYGDNLRRYYGVPAEVGMRVVADGKPGTIERFDREGAYIWVRLDGETEAGKYHPTWRIEYPGGLRFDREADS